MFRRKKKYQVDTLQKKINHCRFHLLAAYSTIRDDPDFASTKAAIDIAFENMYDDLKDKRHKEIVGETIKRC